MSQYCRSQSSGELRMRRDHNLMIQIFADSIDHAGISRDPACHNNVVNQPGMPGQGTSANSDHLVDAGYNVIQSSPVGQE